MTRRRQASGERKTEGIADRKLVGVAPDSWFAQRVVVLGSRRLAAADFLFSFPRVLKTKQKNPGPTIG